MASRMIRKIIFLFIGIISAMSLIFIFMDFRGYSNNVDAGLGVVFLSLTNIFLGIIRVLTSLRTNLSILFRIQDFLYSLIVISILFRLIPFMDLDNKVVSMHGQVATIICLICSVYWSIKSIICGFDIKTKKQ